jgi:BirA family biotin operon repressor/biotin-[acetyl-CoA-carboxylase] ligase
LPAPSALPQLSLVAGLSVCEALAFWAPGGEVRLKWPNDVLLGRRKICGILVESPARPQHRCVIGIGLNVNNSLSEAPEEVRQRAVSLADATGQRWDVTDVLMGVLRQLEISFAHFSDGRLRLSDASRPWCGLTGKRIAVAAGKRWVEGVCAGIDDGGALRVRTRESEQRLFSGVVESILWDNSPEE